jgi:hypothetical protein
MRFGWRKPGQIWAQKRCGREVWLCWLIDGVDWCDNIGICLASLPMVSCDIFVLGCTILCTILPISYPKHIVNVHIRLPYISSIQFFKLNFWRYLIKIKNTKCCPKDRQVHSKIVFSWTILSIKLVSEWGAEMPAACSAEEAALAVLTWSGWSWERLGNPQIKCRLKVVCLSGPSWSRLILDFWQS